MQCDLNPLLRHLCLPSSQPGLLIFTFRNGFWHRLESGYGHAGHRRKLRHASKPVTQAARHWSCSDFSHVNNMNLGSKSLGELSCKMDHRRCCIGKINSDQNAFHVAASSITATAL